MRPILLHWKYFQDTMKKSSNLSENRKYVTQFILGSWMYTTSIHTTNIFLSVFFFFYRRLFLNIRASFHRQSISLRLRPSNFAQLLLIKEKRETNGRKEELIKWITFKEYIINDRRNANENNKEVDKPWKSRCLCCLCSPFFNFAITIHCTSISDETPPSILIVYTGNYVRWNNSILSFKTLLSNQEKIEFENWPTAFKFSLS